MQRLFSTFADGWPGGGILLLRLLAGGGLIKSGFGAMTADAHTGLIIVPVAAAATGLLLVAGLWTPVVGVLAGVVEMWIGFTDPGTHTAVMVAALAISLAMIGPGAWSIDARLYGRKQILPPEP